MGGFCCLRDSVPCLFSSSSDSLIGMVVVVGCHFFVIFYVIFFFFVIRLNLDGLAARKLGKVDWLKPSIRSNDLTVIKSGLICGKSAFILQEAVETLAPNISTGESDPAAAVPAESPHGIEVGVEFKPVERPVEPINLDEPVKCPLPEPSILHVSHPLSSSGL
jgi:hypothetical protein